MNIYKDKVIDLLTGQKLRTLYANTFYSLTDRIDPLGYLEESYIPGRYPGTFVRSSGAYVFLMAENGHLHLAVRALRFVLDTMQRNHLFRAPHVIGKVHYDTDGKLLQELDMICQIDGTAHIFSAYAELILKYRQQEFFDDYWSMMSQMLTAHADQPYFFSNKICGFPVANVNLFLNTAFEHSREERYWCAFDLLSQCFMGASLEKMAAVARKNQQNRLADLWEEQLTRLKNGIQHHLTRTEHGKTIYMEMRLPDSNNGIPYNGIGWVNLSPIAAEWEALEPEIMQNTLEALRKKTWKPDPDNDGLYFLAKEAELDDSYCLETIGKGIGWDIEASRRTEDYRHIFESLDFLVKKHKEDLYGECMFFRDGEWKSRDTGNAEQCIWWCWAIARLRKSLHLDSTPDRNDITLNLEIYENYSVTSS